MFRKCVSYSERKDVQNTYCDKFMKNHKVMLSENDVKNIRFYGFAFLAMAKYWYTHSIFTIDIFKLHMDEFIGKNICFASGWSTLIINQTMQKLKICMTLLESTLRTEDLNFNFVFTSLSAYVDYKSACVSFFKYVFLFFWLNVHQFLCLWACLFCLFGCYSASVIIFDKHLYCCCRFDFVTRSSFSSVVVHYVLFHIFICPFEKT